MALGKRKRDVDPLAITEPKRQKVHMGINHTISYAQYDPFYAGRLPAFNPRWCPLFRLPAELRTQIWTYAYGNLTIDVSLKSLNKSAEDSHKDLVYKRHGKFLATDTSFRLPPLVCKQFYSETTAAFYSTNTFAFDEPHSFRAFALSPHSCVEKFRYLSIPRFDYKWEDSLTSSLIGRLKSLRGVRLSHKYYRQIEARPVPRAASPEFKGFWRNIRAFQQHELEASHTVFEVVVYNMYKATTRSKGYELRLKPGESQYDNLVRLQESLTDGLLQYTPRRLSRRGAA